MLQNTKSLKRNIVHALCIFSLKIDKLPTFSETNQGWQYLKIAIQLS